MAYRTKLSSINKPRKSVFHFTRINFCESIVKDKRIRCTPVKSSILKGNKDFLINEYLVPLMLTLKSEAIKNEIVTLCDAFLAPLILTSYVFSTTIGYGSKYHWKKYATEDGCCIQIKACVLRSQLQIEFLGEHAIYYNKRAFNNRYVKDFLLHYLGMSSKLEARTVNAFIEAVAFSRYPDQESDQEYRFCYHDMATTTPEEYEGRKKLTHKINSLFLSIDPIRDIKRIYFRTQNKREEFLKKMGVLRDAWENRSIVLGQ